MAWINLADEMEFTERAYTDFHVGQILVFDFEGSKNYLKIMRINKPKIWVKQVDTYSIEEFETMTGAKLEERKD